MFANLASLLTLCALLLAAYGLGRPQVRAFRLDEHDPLGRLVWSLALGLIAAGMVLTALGFCGWLYRPVIGALTCSGALLGVAEIVSAKPQTWRFAAIMPASPKMGMPAKWLSGGLLALSCVASSAALIGALAPATDGDALCYHLDLPKVFLAQHSLALPSFNDHATFPLLVEMWYLWALALDGSVAAQLIHWFLGLLMAGAGVLVADRMLPRGWSWLAGAVILLAPGISNQMAAPLNDLALAAFTTLALAAWLRAASDEGPGWYAAAGATLGAACGIKYTALLFAAALGVTWIWSLWRQPSQRPQLLRGAAMAAVIATSIAGPWYARAAWHRGNPVYPFFSQHLGEAAPDSLPKRKTPHGWDAWSLASLPWQLSMHPERFGGRGHQLGVLFLLALPSLIFARRLHGLWSLLALVGLYFLLWYQLRQNVRFLLPIVPPLAVGVVWVWMELRRWPLAPRWLAAAIYAGAATLGAVVPAKRCLSDVPVALGLESRDEYLARCEPSYEVARRANEILEPGDCILSQDYRTFYFASDIVREQVFRRQSRYDRAIKQPDDLDRVLRDAGFTHVLLAEASGPGIRYNPRLSQLMAARDATTGSSGTPLVECRFRDVDGAMRRYRLLSLR